MDERTRFERATGADLELWPSEYQAWVDGVRLRLSPREFEVLLFLIRREGHVVTRQELSDGVWGGRLGPGDRTVDVHVHKARTKLRRVAPAWRHIHTHHSIGYRFERERTSS